jgi:hypothetical protein
MPNLEVLTACRWPTDDFALASIGIRMSYLATRNALPVQQWEEDGLGLAQGVMCRTSSGLVFLLRELQHAVIHLGSKGPEVFVDAEELGARGVEPLLSEVLAALGLSRDDLTWVQDSSVKGEAAARAHSAREYIATRSVREST